MTFVALIGCIPEHALIYAWDQIVMWGGKRDAWELWLPICACVILEVPSYSRKS